MSDQGLRERLARVDFKSAVNLPWENASEYARGVFLKSADGVIAETLSYLSANGLAIVPIAMTEEMAVDATEDWLCIRAMEDRAEAIWAAALRAAPPAADLLKGTQDD